MNKFKAALKKEFYIYLATLFILIIIAHSDILTNPFARFDLMGQKENYFHPIVYALVIYSVIFIVRKLIDIISALFTKKS